MDSALGEPTVQYGRQYNQKAELSAGSIIIEIDAWYWGFAQDGRANRLNLLLSRSLLAQ